MLDLFLWTMGNLGGLSRRVAGLEAAQSDPGDPPSRSAPSLLPWVLVGAASFTQAPGDRALL